MKWLKERACQVSSLILVERTIEEQTPLFFNHQPYTYLPASSGPSSLFISFSFFFFSYSSSWLLLFLHLIFFSLFCVPRCLLGFPFFFFFLLLPSTPQSSPASSLRPCHLRLVFTSPTVSLGPVAYMDH